MFQWLFAEKILSPQDSLKSRTLFAIPHNFFSRNNAFIFFQKSDTLFLHKPGPGLNYTDLGGGSSK